MFWNAFGRNILAATFGLGAFGLAHKPDEYVKIDKLVKYRDVYDEILRSSVVE